MVWSSILVVIRSPEVTPIFSVEEIISPSVLLVKSDTVVESFSLSSVTDATVVETVVCRTVVVTTGSVIAVVSSIGA